MIKIPDPWTGLLVSAVHDALAHNRALLGSETLKDRSDYEEHLVHLEQFFEYIKEEYRQQDSSGRIPLEDLIGEE